MRKHRFLFAPDDPAGQGAGDDPNPDPDDSGSGDGDPHEGTGGPGGQDDLVPRSELQKTSREAAKYRRERNELAKRLEAIDEKDKSEVQKYSDRATKLEADLTKAQEDNRALRVQVLASRVGIVPEARSDAARLLDWDSISDPDSEPEVEEALRTLTKSKPYLLGNVPGGSDGGAGGSRETGSQDMNALLRAASGRA